jgi:hypothetical protein
MAFRRGGDARSIPRIRLSRSPSCSSTWRFGSPIYERIRTLRFRNVFEANCALTHTPDGTKGNMRAFMWVQMKEWLLRGAIHEDESSRWTWRTRGTTSTGAESRHAEGRPSLAR